MNVAILLAGGCGTRLGADIPKQYIKVNNKMIITYAYEVLAKSEHIDKIVIVADKAYHELILNETADDKFLGFATPGENRQQSIYNALLFIQKDDLKYVLIHDAARPLLKAELIDACFESIDSHDGVMPALPMKDTVYLAEDGHINELLDRSMVVAGQAPELFSYNKYLEANERLLPKGILNINGSTEPAILVGMDIKVIPGDESNFKITTENDLKKFEDLLK